MTIEIKGIPHELKYSFNSFKYMEDLRLSDLQNIDETPFKIVPFVETLLLGAVNCNPRLRVTAVEVDEYLDAYIEEGASITELAEHLMELLQESSFFKSLQKKPTKKK